MKDKKQIEEYPKVKTTVSGRKTVKGKVKESAKSKT